MVADDRTGQAVHTPVSSVEYAGSRPTLIVDGRPFFYLGVQISPHRLMDRDGWSWEEIDALGAAAAESGFTVLGVPIRWSRIEPRAGRFDWTDVDSALELAHRHNIRLELIWFGSQVCSMSLESYGTPTFAITEFEQVLRPDRTPLTAAVRDEVYGRDTTATKLDVADQRLLAREAAVLRRLLGHVRSYVSAHELDNVLVGVDVLNEPTAVAIWGADSLQRSHSDSAARLWEHRRSDDQVEANADLLFRYADGLARAVKQSDYQVWTRLNLYEALEGAEQARALLSRLERARADGSASLDFIGGDLYTRDADHIQRYCRDSPYASGGNFVMVMENGGHYENTPELILSAIAADGAYHIWEVCDSMPTWPAGLYGVEDRRLVPKDHQPAVAATADVLRRMAPDLASKSVRAGELAVFNRLLQTDAAERHRLSIGDVTISTQRGTAAVISASEFELVVGATGPCEVELGRIGTPSSASIGRFDADRRWQRAGPAAVTVIQDRIRLAMGGPECARLEFGGGA